ncbi:hypothetical protein KM043_009343 [Ampulex compressa]|nr:hypothetical protein KM043_009343 [Ampulex compressa]
MWFEILPSMLIVGASVVIPQHLVFLLNNLVYGNSMRRNLKHSFDLDMFMRDTRMTGEPWKLAGLENIPDE